MHKIGIAGFLLVALILLSGCAPATTPPSPLPPAVAPPREPAPPASASAPTPTPPRPEIPPEVTSSPPSPAQPSPPFSPVPESHIPDIPLNVTIDYIGVTSAHDQEDIWDPDGEVQLLVLITDGKETPPVSLPPDETGFKMGDFELKKIEQRVFHTASAGEYLKVSIVAYDIDSKEKTMSYLSILEAFGLSGASSLKQLYAMLPQEDDRIGYYESTWYPEDNWGIGQYSAEGIEDLRVWFTIWSDTEPASISMPSLLPDVRIQDVDIPNQVEKSSAWFPLYYKHTLTIVNNEPIDIKIDWHAHSTDTGDFDEGSENIPAGSRKSITRSYFYETAGQINLTYTLSYKDSVIDSWSGTVNVIP